MAAVNKVILIGNLTRDPELRYTQSGTGVAEIGLAVNRKFKAGDDMKEEVTYVDITFWGAQAETVNKYTSKGDPIYIEGRLTLDTWQDKQSGQNRSKLKVTGENFQFLGGGDSKQRQQPSQNQSPRNGPASPPPPQRTGTAPGPMKQPEEDDDIPF